GGMHGSNRLGGNSLSDLLVFGKRAGEDAAAYAAGLERRPRPAAADVAAAEETALAPLSREGGESPYAVQRDLQDVMHNLVGIIRRGGELEEALERLADLRERAAKVGAGGGRRYNPAWHLALDLRNMLLVSECTARAALERTESRGGHTREDFPQMDPQWRRINLACSLGDRGPVRLARQPLAPMPKELRDLFDPEELAKYYTPEELADGADGARAATATSGAAPVGGDGGEQPPRETR